MTDAAASFRFGPALGATVTTVLFLLLLWRIADILLLLFVAILLSLYFGTITDFLVSRLRLPRGLAFSLAVAGTVMAVWGLVATLVPPVVEQTKQLIAVLPQYVRAWQDGLARLVARYPALRELPLSNAELIGAAVEQLKGSMGRIFPTVVGLGHWLINLVAVGVMAIYLALYPRVYREWLIALFPPVHRDLVRNLLSDITAVLRAWLGAQLAAMVVLGFMTAVGLYVLQVPYWLTFGVFVGVIVVVPFFGTLVGTLLPALFVLGGEGVWGLGPGVHFLLVLLLGVLTHLIEGNLVLPLITSRTLAIPPVLTMLAVLVVARLFGPLAVVVAVPLTAVAMVLVRRIVIQRLYEGASSFRGRDDIPLVLRVPAPDGSSVIVGREVDVLDATRPGAVGT